MARKRKPRSRGQIRSRGIDRWLVRVFLGTDPVTGKRRYSSKTVRGSKREAEKELTKMLHEVDEKSFVEPSKTTLGDFLDRWLDEKSDISPGTAGGYARRIKLDIKPAIGHMKLEDVEPRHLSTLYNTTLLKKRGLSGRTVQYSAVILKQAFDQAVAFGILKKNPTTGVTVPKSGQRVINVLSPEQVQALLGRTQGTQWGTLWVTLLTTGLRPQEAAALKWQDINFDERYLLVRRAMKRTNGNNSWAPKPYGKTSKAMRKIRLARGTLSDLKSYRARQAEHALKMGEKFDRAADWVFTKKNGQYRQHKQIWETWKRHLRMAGIEENFRLYDTRHTHATTLLLNGVPVKVVSERLGHSNVSMTLDTYTAYLPEMQEQAADQIDQVFFAPPAVAINQ